MDFGRLILQLAVEIAGDLLKKLSATGNRNLLVHLRTLSITLMFAVLPLWLIYCFPSDYNFKDSFWFLSNSICCCFVTIKAVQEVLIYAILMYDAVVRSIEGIDHLMLGIHFIVGAIQMASISVYFFNLYTIIMAWSDWYTTLMSIPVVLILANIPTSIEIEWNKLKKRRNSLELICKFASVTARELDAHENCAICQRELFTANAGGAVEESSHIVPNVKRTFCEHLFHTGSNGLQFIKFCLLFL